MNLNSTPFNMIKLGQKTIELRLNDEKRQLLNIGDEIEFTNTEEVSKKLYVKVINIYKFSSFEELYENLPLHKCGYSLKEVDAAKASDMNIYYSPDRQAEFGVLGIEIEKI